jgi:CheY-like chemotaxis protein
LETARSPVDLVQAIDAAIEETSELAGSRPVAVVAEYPAHLPAVVGDPKVLPKVLGSLIALVVLGAEQREVRVQAALLAGDDLERRLRAVNHPEAAQPAGPWVGVSIRGGGRIPESPGNGSTPNGRQPSLAPDFAGGLRACERILQDLGGRLWIEDLPRAGSQVNVVLPVHSASTPSTGPHSLRGIVEARMGTDQAASRTLLAIVESPDLGDLLSTDLSSAGYRVLVAGNGRDGLALVREAKPDMILLDLSLRDPSPLELAMLFMHDRRTSIIPILFLTTGGGARATAGVSAVNFLVRQPGTGSLLAAIQALETSGISPAGRVLVAEPDAAVRAGMVMVIQAYGYRVTEASGSIEAMALAERIQPALVLVNAQLAQDRDFWLLRNLRQTSREVGIFVLADGLTEADGQAAVRRGASGYSDTGKLKELLSRVRDQK